MFKLIQKKDPFEVVHLFKTTQNGYFSCLFYVYLYVITLLSIS